MFAALGVMLVLVLAVFPARAYLDQRAQRAALVDQVAGMAAENQALEERTAELRTDAEIERLAREYNLVKPGEEVYFIVPRSDPPPPPAPPPPPPKPGPPSLWERITSIF